MTFGWIDCQMYCWLLCGIKFKWLFLSLELFSKGLWPETMIGRELETMTLVTVEVTGSNYIEKSLRVKRDGAVIAP